MKVALMVDSLTPECGGIGRYTWQLYRNLRASPAIDQLTPFADGQIIQDPALLLQGTKPAKSWLPRPWRRRLTRRRLSDHLIHGPNYFLPPEADTGVITVHDLSVLLHPQTHPAERILAFDREFERSVQRAAHVITDSQFVRTEIISSLGIAAERVTSVPLGVEPRFHPRPSASVQPFLDGLGLKANGYGLCVSTLEPRKRIAELIRAWGRLPLNLRTAVPLVLAGAKGWRDEAIASEVARATREGWLQLAGFVRDEDLPLLYAGARLFAFPSIYEGFGLPPLEAMASGVPVVTSNRSSLPEVCAPAAMLIDPDDGEALTSALCRGLEDEQWRREAIAAGVARAADFSWQRCAEQTIDVYCSLV